MPKKQVLSTELVNNRGAFSERAANRAIKIIDEMDPEELRYRIETEPEKLVKEINQDAPIYELGLSSRYVRQLREDAFPGIPEPDAKTKRQRQKDQESLSEKVHNIFTLHMAIFDAYHDPAAQHPRFASQMPIFSDTSPEGLQRAAEYIDAFDHGTVEEKAEQLIRNLQDSGKIDLAKLDPNRAETYLEHTRDVLRVMQVGTEAQNAIGFLQANAPEKLRDPRLQEFMQKVNAMQELGSCFGTNLDMMCSSLYPELGMIKDPAFQAWDPERSVTIHPEDDPDEPEEREGTVYDKYISASGLEYRDASAASYLKKLNFTKQLNTPLADPTKSWEEKLREVMQMDDRLHVRQYLAAEPVPVPPEKTPGLLPQLGVIPMRSHETEMLLDRYLYHAEVSGFNPSSFHPGLAGDMERLYVKNEKGLFTPAVKPGQTRLTESQIKDLLTSDGKYAFFPAGEKAPQLFVGGKPKKPEKTPKFGPEGSARMKNAPEEQLAREKNVHALELRAFSLNRVESMLSAVFGSDLHNEGNEVGRTYQQTMVHRFRQQPGAEYPDPGKRLTQADVSALTMLSIANTDVNGDKSPVNDPAATAYGGFSMIVNDLSIQRENTNTGIYMEWAVSGRQALAPKLGAFCRDGDPAGLAETIVKGISVLNLTSKNRYDLEGTSLAELIPAVRTTELLENHPELLEAAQSYARQSGMLEQFETARKECAANAKLFGFIRDGMECERRRMEPGMNSRETEAQTRLYSFLKEDYRKHTEIQSGMLGAEVAEVAMAQAEAMQNAKPADILRVQTTFGGKREMLLSEKPMSRAIQLAFQHEGGLEALNSIVAGSGETPDAEQIQGMLEDYGLIPKDDEKPTQDFDYDAAINGFNEKYAYMFDPAETEAAQKRYQSFMDEFALDYNDLRELAANRNISVDEYVSRAMEENRRAEQSAQPEAATLDEVKARLSGENIGRLSGEELCTSFRDLNRISSENRKDGPTAIQCEKLMERLYRHMSDYEKQNPAFTKEKDRYLKKQDYLDAKETIRRGTDAAKQLGGQPEARQELRQEPEQPKKAAPGMMK